MESIHILLQTSNIIHKRIRSFRIVSTQLNLRHLVAVGIFVVLACVDVTESLFPLGERHFLELLLILESFQHFEAIQLNADLDQGFFPDQESFHLLGGYLQLSFLGSQNGLEQLKVIGEDCSY